MTAIEDSSQSTTRRQRTDHNPMHFIVDDHAILLKVDRIDSLIISIFFIAIEVLGLPAMTAKVEEQVVIGLSAFNQPIHGASDIGSRWVSHGVLLVVSENDHVVPLETVTLVHELGHVADVIDTSFKFVGCSKVVYTDQQCLDVSIIFK